MTQSSGRLMRFALRLYRRFLIAYPRSFRAVYGDEMAGLFQDRGLRAFGKRGKSGFVLFWLRALLDILANAALERASVLQRRNRRPEPRLNSKRGDPMLLNLWKDVLFAVRTARQQPGFAAIAIITLTLGIGVATTIFTVVDGVLLRPLPYPEHDRLAAVLSTTAQAPSGSSIAPPFLRDLEERCRLFEVLAGYSPSWGLNLTGSGDPAQIDAAFVSPRLFEILGARPLAGRLFSPEEYGPGGMPAAVVTRTFWEQRFGGGTTLMGQSIVLNDVPYTVVGIISDDLTMPTRRSVVQQRVRDAVLFLPFARNPYAELRRVPVMNVVARLAPGVTLSQARAELSVVARDLARLYPETNRGTGLTAAPLRDIIVGDVRRPLLLLLGAVGCLLLIACTNVANLLLARGLARGRELSVRAALGATRSRIVQQLLIENVLMSALAGIAGIFFASWGVQALAGIGFDALPRIHEARVDGRMLAFTLLVALVTGLLFGLVPAMHGTKSGIAGRLVSSRGHSEASGHHLRNALVIAEIALALMLAISSGLLIQSFWRLMSVNPGFNPDRLTTFAIALPGTHYPQADLRRAFFDRLIANVSSLPAVERVGAVNRLPFSGTNTLVGIEIEGQPAPVRPDANVVDRRVASRDYFRTLGVPLIAGRGFDDHDTADAVQRTAIVNDTMARLIWPGESPIGKRIRLSLLSGPGPWLSVVGVAGDVRHHGLDVPVQPELYVPYSQASVESMFVVIRSGSDAKTLAPSVRGVVRMIDPSLPVTDDVAPIRDLIADSVAQARLRTLLFGAFAAAALALAMIGVYGVVSYSVSRRTRDIGVRMALGAHAGDIRRMVLREGLLLGVMGVGSGALASFALTRLLASVLFGISPVDPFTFVAVSLLLMGIALLAAFVPAHRATRVDPIQALRIE